MYKLLRIVSLVLFATFLILVYVQSLPFWTGTLMALAMMIGYLVATVVDEG